MNDPRTEIGEAPTEHEANAVESVRLLRLLPPAQLEKVRVVTRLLVVQNHGAGRKDIRRKETEEGSSHNDDGLV